MRSALLQGRGHPLVSAAQADIWLVCPCCRSSRPAGSGVQIGEPVAVGGNFAPTFRSLALRSRSLNRVWTK